MCSRYYLLVMETLYALPSVGFASLPRVFDMLLHRSDSVIVVSPLALIMKVCVFVSIYSVKTLPACVYTVSFIN